MSIDGFEGKEIEDILLALTNDLMLIVTSSSSSGFSDEKKGGGVDGRIRPRYLASAFIGLQRMTSNRPVVRALLLQLSRAIDQMTEPINGQVINRIQPNPTQPNPTQPNPTQPSHIS